MSKGHRRQGKGLQVTWRCDTCKKLQWKDGWMVALMPRLISTLVFSWFRSSSGRVPWPPFSLSSLISLDLKCCKKSQSTHTSSCYLGREYSIGKKMVPFGIHSMGNWNQMEWNREDICMGYYDLCCHWPVSEASYGRVNQSYNVQFHTLFSNIWQCTYLQWRCLTICFLVSDLTNSYNCEQACLHMMLGLKNVALCINNGHYRSTFDICVVSWSIMTLLHPWTSR